ncbi:MAG: hypothetical protein AAGF67_06550, partial [Verrucomicrobiota bacterium]
MLLSLSSSFAGPILESKSTLEAAPSLTGPRQIFLHDSDTLEVQAHFQTGVNAVAEGNLFWDLARLATGNNTFDADAEWLESYVEPGLSFETQVEPGLDFFGKISAVASYTSGTDAFDEGDTGRVTLEEGFLGFRFDVVQGWEMEASAGARTLRLGTGMLVANGGADGFERGALKFGPREAWEMSGIVQLKRDGFKATGFFLDANEMASNDTRTEIAGFDLRWDGENGQFLGLSYLHVPQSLAPYPQAAPGGIGAPSVNLGAREG